MRRLFTWLFLVVMLSQFPQVSDQFQEEQEGVQAAYQKAERTVKAAETAYSKTKSDVAKVQESLTKMKNDIDKTSSEVSKCWDSITAFANGNDEKKGETSDKQNNTGDGVGRKAGK